MGRADISARFIFYALFLVPPAAVRFVYLSGLAGAAFFRVALQFVLLHVHYTSNLCQYDLGWEFQCSSGMCVCPALARLENADLAKQMGQNGRRGRPDVLCGYGIDITSSSLRQVNEVFDVLKDASRRGPPICS